MFTPRFWTLASIIVAVAMTRIVPHPWNFTPVGALCLFGGAYFTRKWAAFAVPLLAMFLSDLVLAAVLYDFRTTLLAMPAVYLSFALIVCLGMLLRGRQRLLPIAGAAVGAMLIHYVVTNLAYWAFESYYPKTLDGLAACFIAAIPFQQNMLISNLVFSALLFGGFAWAQKQFPVLQESAPVLAA